MAATVLKALLKTLSKGVVFFHKDHLGAVRKRDAIASPQAAIFSSEKKHRGEVLYRSTQICPLVAKFVSHHLRNGENALHEV